MVSRLISFLRPVFAAALCSIGLQGADAPPRVVQTVLRAPDVIDYDVESVIAYLQRTRADCFVINGGGLLDFFPHEHPMASPNPFLGGRDLLAEIVPACHAAGIRVLARVDFRGVEADRHGLQPDWFSIGVNGRPVMRAPGLYQSCFNSPYRTKYGLYLIRLLLERHNVDGIWYNAIQAPGACYCPRCEERYREATGEAIPRVEPTADAYLGPAMERYRELKADWSEEHLTAVRDLLKSYGGEKVLTFETFGHLGQRFADLGGIDITRLHPLADWLLGKAFVDPAAALSTPSSALNFLRSLDADKPLVLLTSGQNNRFRTIAAPRGLLDAWLWETVAAGGGLWNATVAGTRPDAFADHRNAEAFNPVFNFLRQHGELLADARPVRDVALLFSAATRGHEGTHFREAIQGAEHVLRASHVSFGVQFADHLRPGVLADSHLVLLPNTALLGAAQVEHLRAFVHSGGHLISDYQTSLFTENGTFREEFGLSDVFGIRLQERSCSDTRNSPHAIERPDHPLFTPLPETTVLQNANRMTLVKADSADILATRIPPPPARFPEESWWREDTGATPTITENRFGAGRTIYFAHEIFRACAEQGPPDFHDLLSAAINYLLSGKKRLVTNAPASVHTSLLRRPDGSWLLFILNHTVSSPQPWRDPVPLEHLEFTLRPRHARLAPPVVLHAETPGDPPEFSVSTNASGDLTLRLERLHDFIAFHFPVSSDD